MSEEFKQSLQPTRKDIIKTFIEQCHKNNLANVEYLIDHYKITKDEINKNCVDVLYYASEFNEIKLVLLLLNHGIKSEQCTDAIYIASVNNNIDIIKLFIKYGVKPEQCTEALKFAKDNNNKEIITLLENYINKNKVITDQEIIKQLFTLAKQLKDHSMTITVINKE